MKKIFLLLLLLWFSGSTVYAARYRPYTQKSVINKAFVKGYYSSFETNLIMGDDFVEKGQAEKIEFKDGQSIGLTMGYMLKDLRFLGYIVKGLKIEGEYSYSKIEADNEVDGASVVSLQGDQIKQSIYLNVVWSPYDKGLITPSIGFGAGLSRIEFDGIRDETDGSNVNLSDSSDIVFGSQIFVIASYDLRNNYFIDVKYKYQFSLEKPDLPSEGSTVIYEKPDYSSVSIAVRYIF